MYPWTSERVAWYQRAVDWTGFDRKLADLALPDLAPGDQVCDLGCGTGYLALELARRGCRVTAVDRAGVCLDYLRAEAARRGLTDRLTAVEADWHDLPPETAWDTVVMAFAGKPDEELEGYLARCRRRLVLVTKTSAQSHVRGPGEPPLFRRDADALEAALRARGLSFARRDAVLDFGQPLRSREEAEAYLAVYGGPESALTRLTETGDPEFPLCLPNEKRLAVFTIAR